MYYSGRSSERAPLGHKKKVYITGAGHLRRPSTLCIVMILTAVLYGTLEGFFLIPVISFLLRATIQL